MTDQINAAAAVLAHAEQVVQDAQVVEDGARAEVSDVDAKIAAIKARKVKIRADLEAGTLTDAQAGGLFQIAAADEQDLADILRGATERLGSAIAATREALAIRDRAVVGLEMAERRLKFDALANHVGIVEQTLTSAVAELFALGSSLGMPRVLSAVWRPSAALRNAITLGLPPQ